MKGLRFVIGFLLIATVISVGACCCSTSSWPRSRRAGPRHAGVEAVRRAAEVQPGFVFGGGNELTVRGYVELIRKAKGDSRITGILLKPGGINSPFWAKLQELRGALEDFKTSGKDVHAWLEYGGDREYYLASVADRVYLLPSASLDLTGVASYEVFLRGTFDWIGTYPDFLHVGDYKTAVNTYLEKTFTPAHREMSESLNRSQYRAAGAGDRRRPREEGRRGARADRPGAVPAGRCVARRPDRRSRLRGRARRSRAASCDGADYIDAEDYAAVSWEQTGVRRQLEDRGDQRVRRDQFRQQRFRSGQRRGDRRPIRWSNTSATRAPIARSRRSCCASTARAARRPRRT